MRHSAALLILGLGALGTACNAAKGDTPCPPTDRVGFIYGPSGQPARHLLVFRRKASGPEEPLLPGSADGTYCLSNGDSLRVLDSQSGLMLYATHAYSRPRDGGVRLPLPIRVIGRVQGFDAAPEAVEVHIGSGPRLPVTEYQRREHRLALQPSPQENQAWEMELPPIASRWEVVRPGPEGFFKSGWLAIEGPPQLVITDRSGHLATVEASLPVNAQPHATLNVGTLTPQESATLELDPSGLPPTDLPLALVLGLEKAEPLSADQATALRLTLLNRVAPGVAHFAMRRAEVPVKFQEATRLTGLPPFARLHTYVTGPLPGLLLKRVVSGAGQAPDRLALARPELSQPARRVPLSGVVRDASGKPVAGATVVYSSYPTRAETRTDSQGRYRFPAAVPGRAAVLFLDVTHPGLKAPFNRSTPAERFDIPAKAPSFEKNVQLTSPLSASSSISCYSKGELSDPTATLTYSFANCGSTYTQDPLQLAACPMLGAWKQVNGSNQVTPIAVTDIAVAADGSAQASVQFPSQGSYIVILSYTPFVSSVAFALIDNLVPVVIPFGPPSPTASVVLAAADTYGNPAPQLEIAFPNQLPSLDPYEGLTGELGTLQINCFNEDPVSAFVDDPRGCFEGAVYLKEPNLQLGSCSGF
jgi:hypothetical protein